MTSSRPDSIRLVIGTRNRKKGEEMAELIHPAWEPNPHLARLSVGSLADHPEVADVVEDADTFAGNARKKASETALSLRSWVLADDSGLTVDALNGAPGVFSARYAGAHGDDDANNRKLLDALAALSDDQRGAAFVCHIALADPDGTIRLESEGACRGRITRAPQGNNGFGYDPLFLIPEYHKTFGELSSVVKRQLSHRARAFSRFRDDLARLIASNAMG
ncbi:RdgB/HAM1 family non-canonical purine NTP pyrophosphatase [Singulisphaera acidiphila]|uniref:dITP/XTP pyrophosphatase n=1 Tax=Singulisphaera acidiphila (strain ATCC BAA-1392 / DSM 18658 / VKM B-2454 / MOB10) TaxID=886293 RepID=L0DCJ3_SINAD|nr:RdgB/HAM1 family non-canonical purine NTP pyrophosphatase [Singulisphaera acidiphila]AGA26952.1 non-canonical purine NTP pyrophosphatase, rdgB/HAM1 family [Singulisphaera acidiphila DSM 18658]